MTKPPNNSLSECWSESKVFHSFHGASINKPLISFKDFYGERYVGLGVLRVHGGENIVGTGRGFKDTIRHRNRVSYPRYPDKKRPRYESTPDWPWATNHPASHIISYNFYRISSTISRYSPRRKLCIRLIIICPVSLYRGREREREREQPSSGRPDEIANSSVLAIIHGV